MPISKSSELVSRFIAGETVIVPVADRVGNLDSIYTLNETGTLIWNLIDGKRSLTDIVDGITSEYKVSTEDATRDLFEFLEKLESASLVRP